MVRKGPLEDVVSIDVCRSSGRTPRVLGAILIENIGPSQQVHHILEIRVSSRIGLGIGDSWIAGCPSHTVAHEIN